MVNAWNNPVGYKWAWLMAAPTYRMLEEIIERPMVSKFIEMGLMVEHNSNSWEDGHNRTAKRSILKNGNIIYYRSMDDPDLALSGLDIAGIHADEGCLISEYGWDMLKGRLLLSNGPLTVGLTPKGMGNHVYRNYFGPDRKDHPHLEVFRYKQLDNPEITADAVARARADYDPLLAAQELDGEWVNLTQNAVYYSFTEANNVLPVDAKINPALPVYVLIDYNIGINAYLVVQRNPRTREIIVIDEGYGARTTRDLGNRIKQLYGTRVFIIDDATGKNRQQSDGQTNRQTLQQCGLWNITSNESNPHRLDRYANVNAHCENGIGDHHLKISPRCKKLIEEMKALAFKPGTDRVETHDGTAGHITDALGYGTYYLSGGLAAWSRKPTVKVA